MKRLIPLSVFFWIATFSLSQTSAQHILANHYLDTAVSYQRVSKNYAKALKYYELAIQAGNEGNYTYYNAAQCACQTGQTEKAIGYYKKGFAQYIDYDNYEYFASDTLIKCFSGTSEWKRYLAAMKPKYDSVNAARSHYLVDIKDTLKRINRSKLSDSASIVKITRNKTPEQLISWIKSFKGFQNPPQKNHGTVYYIKVKDSLKVPFYVFVPESYDAAKKNKLYIFLHGGVSQRPNFYSTPMLYSDDQKILKKSIQEGSVIIYPLAKKGFNWLLNIEAFETILKEISFVKSLYNIDDNNVFVGGHSDGGTATFWLATHKAYPFAGFLGINYNPRAYFGNTNLANLKNNTLFLGLSATDDATFNIKNVKNVIDYGTSIGDKWHGFILGGGHSLPFDNPEATYFAYDSLFLQTRDPLIKSVQWETDNVKNGRSYWLEITKLDTMQTKADWQKLYTPPSVTINGKTISYNFYPHKSGAVKATINQNNVYIQSSCVKELVFDVLLGLVDLTKPVKIFINDKQVFNSKIYPDKQTILDEFIQTKDRTLIVVKKIKLSL